MRAVLFHNVIAEPLDGFDRQLSRDHANRFRQHVAWLAARYEIVSLPEALEARSAAGARLVVLTFDDGYAGVYEAARPVLDEIGAVGAVFVHTDPGAALPPNRLLHFERLEIAFRLTTAASLDLERYGLGTAVLASDADRLRELRRIKRGLKTRADAERRAIEAIVFDRLGVSVDRMDRYAASSARFRKLSAEQIRALAGAGWTVGGHTRTHPVLSQLPDRELTEEIEGNARDLERVFGLAGAPFAYPFGGDEHVDDRTEQAVREAGFRCAFTTVCGENDDRTNMYRLRRFSLPELQADTLDAGAIRRRAGGVV